jgi:hypothetical protein
VNIKRFLAIGYWFFLLFNIWWAIEMGRLQKDAYEEDALEFLLIYIIPVSISYLMTIVASIVCGQTALRLAGAQIPIAILLISSML